MKPSVGRIVHYVAFKPETPEQPPACRAAIVTDLSEREGRVGLAVLHPQGVQFIRHCKHSEGDLRAGTWHWPERVEEEPK